MDPRPASRFAPALVLAALALAPLLQAQTSRTEESGFGTDDLQVITVPHTAFHPLNSTQTYFASCCGADSYRYPTSGPAGFIFALDAGIIPNGARLVRIDAFVRDTTALPNEEMVASLCRTWVGLDGASFASECPFSSQTTGSPGDTALTIEPDHTVRYQADADSDGDEDSIGYQVLVNFGLSGFPHYTNSLRLRAVRILYRRQVTPAPSSATFGDVPTSHPFFQFIEALAASGITAGCGGGNYCPENPLTRGQMAVFLAKALGLHWPGPAIP